jgi:hypothetical protein
MPIGLPTPKYKFRLLCRRCNSYMHTAIEQQPHSYRMRLLCKACGTEAEDLDEAHKPDSVPDKVVEG